MYGPTNKHKRAYPIQIQVSRQISPPKHPNITESISFTSNFIIKCKQVMAAASFSFQNVQPNKAFSFVRI